MYWQAILINGVREKAVDFASEKFSQMAMMLLSQWSILLQTVVQRPGIFASCDQDEWL